MAIPPMTKDEEVIYVKKAQEGNTLALEKLIRSQIRFICNIARRYVSSGVALTDLVQEGCIGLKRGIMEFNRFDNRLISYAMFWIRQYITRYIAEHKSDVRIPVNQVALSRKDYKRKVKAYNNYNAKRSYEHKVDDLVSDDLADSFSMMVSPYMSTELSLDKLTTDNDDLNMSTVSLLVDSSADVTFEDDEFENLERILRKHLRHRDFELIATWLGCFGYDRLTHSELGERYNLSRERVRQLRERVAKQVELIACQEYKTSRYEGLSKRLQRWGTDVSRAIKRNREL